MAETGLRDSSGRALSMMGRPGWSCMFVPDEGGESTSIVLLRRPRPPPPEELPAAYMAIDEPRRASLLRCFVLLAGQMSLVDRLSLARAGGEETVKRSANPLHSSRSVQLKHSLTQSPRARPLNRSLMKRSRRISRRGFHNTIRAWG